MKIFFSGIGGSGVSAIAGFMADGGDEVWGSDRAFDRDHLHPLLEIMKDKKIKIVPQDGNGIDGSFDEVVFSTAVERTNPEYIKACSLGLTIRTRPEFLIELSKGFQTIAVAGTSGKSTTSGMLAYIMDALGMSPNFIGGGRVKRFRVINGLGNYLRGDSGILVIEACESDGSIVHYRPEMLLLLNLELDHHPVKKTREMFQRLIDNTSGRVVVNGDDRNLEGLRIRSPLIVSLRGGGNLAPEDVVFHPLSTEFILRGVRFRLDLPGLHNLYNALFCITLLSDMGIPLKDISEVLSGFNGIERRFDIVLNTGGKLVIDDYAHNPHKLEALIRTVRFFRERICFIFQPHGFGPTRLMKDGYIKVFSECLSKDDHLILLPIFYSGGTVQRDISSNDLAGPIRRKGISVEVIDDREEIFRRINRWDTFIVAGARDEGLSLLARRIAAEIQNLL